MDSILARGRLGAALFLATLVGACGGATESSTNDPRGPASASSSGGSGGATSSSSGGGDTNPPAPSSTPAPAYRAWAQQSGDRMHIFAVRADFEKSSCVRVHLVAPFGPATNRYKEVSLPPQWNVQNLTETADINGCLEDEWAGAPQEAIGAEGSISVNAWASNGFVPCLITLEIKLTFPRGTDRFVVEALPVEGCMAPSKG